jgi:hypothetical protein
MDTIENSPWFADRSLVSKMAGSDISPEGTELYMRYVDIFAGTMTKIVDMVACEVDREDATAIILIHNRLLARIKELEDATLQKASQCHDAYVGRDLRADLLGDAANLTCD